MTGRLTDMYSLAITRRMVLGGAALVAAGRVGGVSAFAQSDATPAAGLLTSIAEATVRLDGKERLWQINRVIVQDDDDDEEFRVRLGFAYAHEIPVELDFDDAPDVTLQVGQGVAIQDRQEIEAEPVGTSIGSFYTLELIDPADVNNDENRLAIGNPFPTDAADYTMTLWHAAAAGGSTVSFGEGATNALVLLLDGNLTYTRENGESTTLAMGEAASGAGAGQVEVGVADAAFLVVTLLPVDGQATPTS